MKEIFQQIWEMALPYQDKRDDKGHAEITLSYTKILVGLEKGNEDIVIPAIILHDIGWSQLPWPKRLLIFDRDAKEAEILLVRLQHQIEGVKLARNILDKVSYPEDMTKEILKIISDHDTRQGFISRDEGLVRDADKLWRFSKAGFEADINRYRSKPDSLCNKLETDLKNPTFFYSKAARQIALEELELRRKLS